MIKNQRQLDRCVPDFGSVLVQGLTRDSTVPGTSVSVVRFLLYLFCIRSRCSVNPGTRWILQPYGLSAYYLLLRIEYNEHASIYKRKVTIEREKGTVLLE